MKIFTTMLILIFGMLLVPGATVEELISELRQGDKVARREAARSLAQLGPKAKPAVPALVKALDDDQEQVFFWAATALANLGPDAQEAAPELIKRLRRSNRRYRDQVRLRVVTALTRIGPAAVPQLIDALDDESESIRSGAARVLGNIGPDAREAAPRLSAQLADEEGYIGETAGAALGKIGPAAHPQILEALGSEEETVRAAAAVAIGWMDRPGEPAQHLAKRLEAEPSSRVMANGLEALNRAGLPGGQLLPLLLPALDHDSDRVRHEAINALLNLRPDSREAVPHLIQRLGDGDPAKRGQAIDLLGRIGPDAGGAVPRLIAHLGQAAREEQAACRQAMVEMGPAAVPGILASAESLPLAKLDDAWQTRCLGDIGPQAAPALVAALEAQQAGAPAYLALLGLKNIRAKSAVARRAVVPFLEHEQEAFRGAALAALVASSAKPASLMPRLQAAMRDDNALVRQAAMDALASLGPSARGATSALVESLGDDDAAIRLSAVRAIGKLGSDDAALAKRLAGMLDGAGTELRLAVVKSLGGFRKLPGGAVTGLVGVLGAEHAATQSAAFDALAKLGPEAKPALPALSQAVSHADADVRASALNALAKVEPDDRKLLSALRPALGDSSAKVRHTAIRELGELGSDARPAGPELFARLDTSEDRQVALEALRRVRVRDVDLYISALGNEEPLVRLFACQALRRAGEAARKALPEIRKLTRDSYDFVRREARRAMEALE
ncbi:MAG: HEAT repeat domain-containing protein [Verrucomicrobia bacterium]|nr:HEAT repeat domain-containing protein [Verrucomicrobiota bacterium]